MSVSSFHDGRAVLHGGDCLDVLDTLADNSIDSVVCDPPYHLTSIVKRFGGVNAAPAKEGTDGLYARASRGFMGKEWDGGDIAFRPETWAKVLRVLKPGGHLVAFSAPKCSHRMVCAIEDAGFEIRDGLMWMFGTGFPKSHDVSKGIDRAARAAGAVRAVRQAHDIRGGNLMEASQGGERGKIEYAYTDPATDAARQWDGWGTALKPAYEPICLARKPLDGTVAANVLAHGVGAINIDACRVGSALRSRSRSTGEKISENLSMAGGNYAREIYGEVEGRWPSNIVHDGSGEVVAAFPATHATVQRTGKRTGKRTGVLGEFSGQDNVLMGHDDAGGSAARFFYSAKADSADRIGSKHPTVKPVDLMQWLCRLVTPNGGLILDPFAGSGTTGEAALREGFRVILIEREAEYREDIARRLDHAFAGAGSRSQATAKAKGAGHADLPLFGGEAVAS